MGKFTARFTQKLGPLPVWAWAAIALLLILGYMYWKKVGFFGSGTSTAPSTGTPTDSSGTSPLSSLLGNIGLMPDPAAYASTGLAGGGGTGGSGSNSGAFGPTITTYDMSAGGPVDRGASTVDTSQPSAPVTLASLGVLSPGQNYEPNYAATNPGPIAAPAAIPSIVRAAAAQGLKYVTTSTSSQVAPSFNPVRSRSSGTQAV